MMLRVWRLKNYVVGFASGFLCLLDRNSPSLLTFYCPTLSRVRGSPNANRARVIAIPVPLDLRAQVPHALLGYRHVLVVDLHEQYDLVDVRPPIRIAMVRRPTMDHAALHTPLRHPMLPAGPTALLSHSFVRPDHVYTPT